MKKAIRVLLADDHNVLRQGMAQALDMQPDIIVIAQAENGNEAVELSQQHRPDVVLMDINMPQMDGVEATRQITAVSPESNIIILTMYRRDDYVFEAIKAGASGYLLKEVELNELLAGIRAVAAGEAIIDTAVAGRVLAAFRDKPDTEPDETPDLDERDLDILRLLAKGLTNQEIADQLHLAEKTIRNRLTQIFRKLHLENRSQAILYALREGLSDDEIS